MKIMSKGLWLTLGAVALLFISGNETRRTGVAQGTTVHAQDSGLESLCQEAESRRGEYLEIWKRQFLKRNHMTQTYFSDHVSNIRHHVGEKYSGICHPRMAMRSIVFQVHYRVTYDWAVVYVKDHFTVLLRSQILDYEKPLPLNKFFDEKQITYFVDENIRLNRRESLITPVKPIDKLMFSGYEAAANAFREKFNSTAVVREEPYIYAGGDGYPYLYGTWRLNEGNRCFVGYLNLTTGETHSHDLPCDMKGPGV
jgi:hypothetical protein